MKKISVILVSLVAISLASLVWYGCTKDSDEDLLGTIYGTVTDYATTQPIGGVNVTLRPSGETTLTGNDGTFEFNDLKANKYSLSFSKAEYADLDDDYIIELEAGKKVKRDVQMRKRIASLQVIDMNGNPLDTLDFGTEESVTVKTFNLFNDGTESLTCTASYECDWITNVSGLENPIQPGQTAPVTVRIDRVALEDGVNVTFLYITSGNGSNEVVIKATFQGTVAMTTTNASNVGASSATVGGNITDDGGRPVLERGICYGTSQSPDINGEHTQDGSGTGTFSHNITGLNSSTTYYARAYATNRNGTYYASNIVSFTTTDGLPTVTTTAISDITATTAKSGGNVTNNGGYNVTARGVCWNTMGGPDLNDQHTTNGSGNGTFTSNMTGLTAGTTYYVRAYATNSQGTSYGSEKTFTTNNGLPQVTTGAVSNITATTAVCSGNVTSDGGIAVTAKGFCWSTAQYPNVSGSHSNEGGGIGPFNGSLTNLQIGTTYYVRAYATNSTGTVYGEQVSFTTGSGLPTVTTTDVSVSGGSVVSGGNVTSDGGYPVTARGICYGVYPNPDLSTAYTHTSDGSGTGYYTSVINSTMTGTIYVRAYATNMNGTDYGNEITVNMDYLTLPTFTYNGTTYKVAPTPSNTMCWSNAETYCNGLTLYGYSDWRLPTGNELYQMYLNRTSIGGFVNDTYWGDKFYSGGYYKAAIVDFSTEQSGFGFCYLGTVGGCGCSYYVRPIRVEN